MNKKLATLQDKLLEQILSKHCLQQRLYRMFSFIIYQLLQTDQALKTISKKILPASKILQASKSISLTQAIRPLPSLTQPQNFSRPISSVPCGTTSSSPRHPKPSLSSCSFKTTHPTCRPLSTRPWPTLNWTTLWKSSVSDGPCPS